MKTKIICLSILVLAAATSGFAPIVPKAEFRALPPSSSTTTSHSMLVDPSLLVRGGGVEMASAITSSLQSGPYGILSLWAVASSVVIPATIYRQGWAFSVGYGFSVMTMGLIILRSFANLSGTALLLARAVTFYGFRLGGFLLFRNTTVKSKGEQMKTFDKTPRLKRIPFAASVALFYAFMTTPALYSARSAGTVLQGPLETLSKVGAGIAWVGALVEAISDAQKYVAKSKAQDKDTFVGPTEGLYRISRHPNYLGELIFWFGLFLGGAPSFGKSFIIPWVCSLFGLYGIYSIMTMATARLDKKQAETYGGQEKYDSWKKSVAAPLFPFVEKTYS